MVTPRTFSARRIVCLCLGTLLALASQCAMSSAGTPMATEPTVSVSDLEHLVQQIEDPHQRAQLLDTLRALIVAARQGQAISPPQSTSELLSDQSQGLFFAFGELTQRFATFGHKVGHGIAMLPMLLGNLPAVLRRPTTFRYLLSIVVSAGILLTLSIIFHLSARRLERQLRARTPPNTSLSRWQKVWLALITVGLAAAPYVALLIISGIVFSFFPTGAIPAGLAALLIFTFMLYRLACAVALVLLDPDAPNARLLPIDDHTAQQAWTWVVRLFTLAAVYFLITRGLRTIGVAAEFYQSARGIMIIMVAGILTALIARLARAQHASLITPLEADWRRWSGVMAVMRKIWPIMAITYIWCAALLALFSFQHDGASIVAASLQMAVLIGVTVVLLWGVDLLFDRAVALNDRVGRYLPGLEARLLRYLKTVWWSIRVLIIVVGFLSILQVWGVEIVWFFTSPWGSTLLAHLITVLLTVTAVMFVMDLSSFISQKLVEPTQADIEASRKRKTLVPLTATVIRYGALFVGGLIILHQVGANITPILAGVGILSLAVGFGAQTLVKDIINGLFILVEDSISVGDVVNIRGSGGVVEAVNLRTIWLRDLQGSVHIIPNSQVEISTNMTKDYAYYMLDVGVAYHEDTDEVTAALQEIDAGMRGDLAFAADMLAPIEILGVDRFTDSAVVIRARLKTKPIKQWSVGREFNRRMKKLFDARGIEIPFPQLTIHWGDRKRGKAAPMHLQKDTPEALATPVGRGEGQGAVKQGGDMHAQ
jgi:moderate conductance mechanosensitive channel